MATAAWSLRARLTGLLIGVALVAWGAGSLWLYLSAVAEVDRLSDAAIMETAHAVLAVADRDVRRSRERGRSRDDQHDDEHEIELERVGHDHAENIFYQVRNRRGEIAYRSPGAPQAPLAPAQAAGFTITTAAGEAFRVYTVRAGDDGATIHVAQPLEDRRQLSRASALRLLLPGVGLIVLLGVGTGYIVRRVMLPVVAYSGAIDTRQPGDSAPVDHGGLPSELMPVARAVDRLLDRVEGALRHERTLTADAAHELRTPLAALRAQAQVALRSTDADERAEALRALMGGVDRATHLVNAVLTLARLDASQIDVTALPQTDLAKVAQLVVEELQPAASQRNLTLRLQAARCVLKGDADALAVLLKNLVENAIKHARSAVLVQVTHTDTEARITVTDDGSGLPPGAADRIFDRFYRGAGAAEGAGLGLALVRRVAQLHGGRVAVDAAVPAGARFIVTLPRVAGP